MHNKNDKCKAYRIRWSSRFIGYHKAAMPLLIMGVLLFLLTGNRELFDKMLTVHLFFSPVTLICCLLNIFVGRKSALFMDSGIWLLENEEKLLYINYSDIEQLVYHPSTATRYVHNQSNNSSVYIKYRDCDTEQPKEYVILCGFSTEAARCFAEFIARAAKQYTGVNIPVRYSGSNWMRTGIVVLLTIIVTIASIV